jgi:CheY-like chemotaxis protein
LARKILLADDSVTAQNMGRRILSDAGYEVVTVNNGSAALKKISESKPDLIVLDVYMPGYGGLEVCQRLRESKDTARIPILLTVGKLEPFKPEEARRVRADAFIVKPFEASELLTALTKLEDRIVPQPAPYKPGRFAKAMSALESDAPSNEYGDLDSGWKSRLKIPAPQSRVPDVEPEEQAEPRKTETRKEQEQQPVEIPAAVPRDITPEEIAAIHAAAAAFGTQAAEPVTEPEAVIVNDAAGKTEEAKPEVIADMGDEVAATFASAAPSVEPQAEPETLDVEHKSELAVVVEATQADTAETAVSAMETVPMQAPAEEIASVAPLEAPPMAEERDDFAAALESLGPSNGHGIPQQFSGPRWTAELVAIADEESALILEQEMQKAVAAMAAVHADEAGHSIAVASEATASISMEDAHPSTVEASDAQEIGHHAPTSLVAAMTEETAHQTALLTLAELVDSVLPRASTETETATPELQGAAFAAAAAGNADAISQSSAPPEVTPSPSNADERQRESELAAAWESWKHIRESVVEPQLKSQVADVAAETHSPQAEQHSSPQPEFEDETGAQEEAGIASIVDSVLAELKPKLMAEISKKMGNEKKRK